MDDRAPDGPREAAGTTPAAGAGDPTVGMNPAGETVPLGEGSARHVDSPVGDPDATRPVSPLSDSFIESHLSGTGDPQTGQTRPLTSDRTQALPPLRPAADTTAMFPEGQVPPYRRQANDTTAVGPPVPEGWKGQATVRPGTRDEDSDQWGAPTPNRAWWLPILLGVAGLVLILAIVYALVVVTRGDNSPAPAPSPTPSATATPGTSAPPSTPPSAPPSTAPSGPPSGVIPIPLVIKGIDVNAAKATLESIGLVADPEPVSDPNHIEGTVVDTSPAVGALVQPGTVVILYFAVPPPPPSSAPPSGPPSGATPPSGTPSS